MHGSEQSPVILRKNALQDAMLVTELDERWGKGWYRLAEVLNAVRQDASSEDVAPEKREEGAHISRDAVLEALENAVNLSDGKVKAGMSCDDLLESLLMVDYLQKRKLYCNLCALRLSYNTAGEIGA